MESVKSSTFDKIMVVVDALICSICLFLHICGGVNYVAISAVYIVSILLRLWLGVLNYRRSNLAALPLAMLMLYMAIALSSTSLTSQFLLRIIPLQELLYRTAIFFGIESNGALLDELDLLFAAINVAWFIALPLFVHIYRRCKRQTKASSLTKKQVTVLSIYTVAVIVLSVILSALSPYNTITLATLSLLLLFTPLTIGRTELSQILSKEEKLLFSTFALLLIAGFVGLEMSVLISAVAVALIPIALFALANRYSGIEVRYGDIILLFAASTLFWWAQYTTNMVRITLLLSSMALMAIVIVRFAYATKRFWASTALYILTAVVAPMLSLGYNPYTTLEATRVSLFTEYQYAKRGILLVKSKSGIGLRDRYSAILPTDKYDHIEIICPEYPYCKAYKDSRWQIYDIARHRVVSHEWFNQITHYNDNSFMLKNESGIKYLNHTGYDIYEIADSPLYEQDMP